MSDVIPSRPPGVPPQTSIAMLRAAVKCWARMGTDVQVSEYLGCRPGAVKTIAASAEWRHLALEMRGEIDLDLEQTFTRLGYKALAQLEDRLKYGDFYITRTGERARRPLDAKTLMQAAQMTFDKREEARNRVDGKQARPTDALADALNHIAETLRSTVPRMQRTSPEIIDVESEPNGDPTRLSAAEGSAILDAA